MFNPSNELILTENTNMIIKLITRVFVRKFQRLHCTTEHMQPSRARSYRVWRADTIQWDTYTQSGLAIIIVD